mmetsp:Transcript_30795/g.64892  ORF Transcript_30795/g.64892 Transcript_30795/m.64892 type:complete len:182 (-) Transcript_30795:1922-2467(-)
MVSAKKCSVAVACLLGGASGYEMPVMRPNVVVRHSAISRTQPAMSLDSSRRAQLGALAAGFAAVSSSAVAAEPRSTPWAYSTFLEAVETDQIEKVSFAADGKQVLSIDRDGNRCSRSRGCRSTPNLMPALRIRQLSHLFEKSADVTLRHSIACSHSPSCLIACPIFRAGMRRSCCRSNQPS